jgi:flagellar protein FlbD
MTKRRISMIRVSRLRSKEADLVVNAELIELIETTPDTVITLTTGHKVIAQESADEIVRLVVAYKRSINLP